MWCFPLVNSSLFPSPHLSLLPFLSWSLPPRYEDISGRRREYLYLPKKCASNLNVFLHDHFLCFHFICITRLEIKRNRRKLITKESSILVTYFAWMKHQHLHIDYMLSCLFVRKYSSISIAVYKGFGTVISIAKILTPLTDSGGR